MTRRHPTLGIVLLLTILAAACSDDDPTGPRDDADAPRIVYIGPVNGSARVPTHHPVAVLFSEPMDLQVIGDVSIEGALVTSFTWNVATLIVEHTGLPEAAEVTVTVGDGFTSRDGRRVAAPRSSTFWTTGDRMVLLRTTPADGAVDINRDRGFLLTFSRSPSATSLAAHVTIADTETPQTTYPFTVEEVGGHTLLIPAGSLPADTYLELTVRAGLQSTGGTPLAETTVVGFTTGVEVDDAPPVVVSTTPPNGAAAAPTDLNEILIRFDEPVDRSSLSIDAFNGPSYGVLTVGMLAATWNDDGTELSMPLITDLVPGARFEVLFAPFRDLAGHEQTTPFRLEFNTAGAADHLALEPGRRFVETVEWGRGMGSGGPREQATVSEPVEIVAQPDGDLRLVRYRDDKADTPNGAWDDYLVTDDALQWTGFAGLAFEPDKGPGTAVHEFATPLTILPLPVGPGNWTDATTIARPGLADLQVELSGLVSGQGDVEVPDLEGRLYYTDAWRVVLLLIVRDGDQVVYERQETTYYTAGLGPALVLSRETGVALGLDWWDEIVYRLPPVTPY